MIETSIIIPVYNADKYLEKCVCSALEQTRGNLEVIVVNDGSTDRTPLICEQLRERDSRVRIIHKDHSGVSATRNLGLQAAIGEYVFFLDGDDWIPEYCLSDLHALRERAHADIVISNFCRFDQEKGQFAFYSSEKSYYERNYTPKELFARAYASENNFATVFTMPVGKLYRHEFYNHILYPDRLIAEDDYTTWKLYLLADHIAFINKAEYIYRQHGAGISAESSMDKRFPLKPIEQRIAVLSMLGMDITQEIEAYKIRMAVQRKVLLHSGTKNVEAYHEVMWMKQLLDKYNV